MTPMRWSQTAAALMWVGLFALFVRDDRLPGWSTVPLGMAAVGQVALAIFLWVRWARGLEPKL